MPEFLRTTLALLLEFVKGLEAATTDLRRRLSESEARGVELEARHTEPELRLAVPATSENSSLPPSKDLRRKYKPREPTGKKPGGQPGHEGKSLSFSDNPDRVEEVAAESCGACGRKFEACDRVWVRRTQGFDVLLRTETVEKRYFKCACACGHVDRAPPAEEPPLSYGPGVKRLALCLNVAHYLALRRLAPFFAQTLNLPISEGTLWAIIMEAGKFARGQALKIRQALKTEPVVGSDETPFKLNGKRGYFWVWQSPRLTYIVAAQSRGKKVRQAEFPDGFPGAVLVSDRYAAQ